MKIELKKKKCGRFKAHLSLRISEERKAEYLEMSYKGEAVADALRDIVEPAIIELFRQYKKGQAS